MASIRITICKTFAAASLLAAFSLFAASCTEDTNESTCEPGEPNCYCDPVTNICEEVVAEVLGDSLFESDGFNSGYSPSVAMYPADANASQNYSDFAVAYKVNVTEPTSSYSIEVLTVRADSEGQVSATTVTAVQSTDEIGIYLGLAITGDSRIVVAYYNKTKGQLEVLWEQADGSWEKLVVDSTSSLVGGFVDIAADQFASTGTVYLSYIDFLDQNLKYAALQDGKVIQGGTVSDSLVDSGKESGVAGGQIDKKTSIAVDPLGNPAISYYDASNGQLRVARLDPATNTWQVAGIGKYRPDILIRPDATGRVTLPDRYIKRREQIVVTADGIPIADEIKVVNDTQIDIPNVNTDLEYAVTYVKAISSNYGQWNSIAFDDAGTVYVSFYDFAGQALGVATNPDLFVDPDWRIQVVDTRSAGDANDIAIRNLQTESGVGFQPVVSYYDGANADLKIGWREQGTWQTGDFDTAGITGLDSSIAVGDDGYAVIAYRVYDINRNLSRLRVFRTVLEVLKD